MYLKINKKTIYFRDALSFWNRFIGFMFCFQEITSGIRFPKCRSIHTFLMFQKLDIIITNKDNKIIALYPNFKTEGIILSKRDGYYVYELPLNSIQNLVIGDTLKIYEKNKKEII